MCLPGDTLVIGFAGSGCAATSSSPASREPKTKDWQKRAKRGTDKPWYNQNFSDWQRHGKRGAGPFRLRIPVAG